MIRLQTSDNRTAYLRTLDDIVPERKVWQVTLANDARSEDGYNYPKALQVLAGYSVINAQHWLGSLTEALREAVKAPRFDNAAMTSALDKGNAVEVAFYQAHTGAFKRPRAGQTFAGPRPVHHKGWADWREKLAASFYSRINGASEKRYRYAGATAGGAA